MLNITLTSAAIKHIKAVMKRNHCQVGFRLSMKKYGCNGYGYLPDVVNSVPENDIELSLTDKFRFFVDPEYKTDLDGTCIDYVEQSLGQYQMVFKNPNAEGECGCGESVNLKSRKEHE